MVYSAVWCVTRNSMPAPFWRFDFPLVPTALRCLCCVGVSFSLLPRFAEKASPMLEAMHSSSWKKEMAFLDDKMFGVQKCAKPETCNIGTHQKIYIKNRFSVSISWVNLLQSDAPLWDTPLTFHANRLHLHAKPHECYEPWLFLHCHPKSWVRDGKSNGSQWSA